MTVAVAWCLVSFIGSGSCCRLPMLWHVLLPLLCNLPAGALVSVVSPWKSAELCQGCLVSQVSRLLGCTFSFKN